MPDYSKCFIYKLCCKDATIENIYIGSTTHVNKRKCDHKKRCLNPNDKEYNSYKYQFIRDNGGWDNWQLIVLEQFSCESKMQKEKIERSYVETLKPTLNRTIPANYQTGDVYNAQEYNQKYKKANKDKICKPYTCECGRTIQYSVKARHFRSKVHQDYISSSASSSNEEA